MVNEITHDQVQEIIKSHDLCIVNFGAPWCIDCRRAAPFYKNSQKNSRMSISLMLTLVSVMENYGNNFAVNMVSAIFRQ